MVNNNNNNIKLDILGFTLTDYYLEKNTTSSYFLNKNSGIVYMRIKRSQKDRVVE